MMPRLTTPAMRHEGGQRNAMGWAALLVGSAIAAVILWHWLFAEQHRPGNDVLLGGAFFGGLGIAFPEQVERYARSVGGVIRSWRKA